MSTSKLKRKADHEPELLADNNLNESFVSFGTPLPSLASTRKDQGEYVPVWKQEVRDEKGRRRLHGAFTGGFSAGYFNTVGSKEGWAPSTFVSSKDAKIAAGRSASNAVGRPEDFMDEEDLAELKANRGFKTSDEYGNIPSSSAAGLGTGMEEGYSSAIGNAMKDLVKPGSSKVGEQMMIKMGWKPGQGVGPRVPFARRQVQMREAGLLGPQADQEDFEVDSDEAKRHLYAPIDQPMNLYENKENTWCLGYVPGPSLMHDLDHRQASDSKGKGRAMNEQVTNLDGKRMPVGGAFGISALEDPDEDDDDIYASAPKGGKVVILHDEHDESEYAGFGRGSKRRPELLDFHKNEDTQLKERKKPPRQLEETQKFADGSSVTTGFKIANQPQPPDKWYPSTPVPKGWQPNPKAVLQRDNLTSPPSKDSKLTATPSGAISLQQKGKPNLLSADDRGSILGEPVAPKSVFEYISSKNKERLQAFSQNKNAVTDTNAVQVTDSAAAEVVQPEDLQIPAIEARVAQNALKGFMPYGDDLTRQARYKAYLSHFAASYATGDSYTPQPLSGKTISDLNRELSDFANAAAIFKPMTGMMANRFTSGTSTSALLDIKGPEAGLHKPTPSVSSTKKGGNEEENRKKKDIEERIKDEKDPRRLAVKAGQFGPLTRINEPWYPARLLCKRFNIADPHPDGQTSMAGSFSSGAGAGIGSGPPGNDKDVLGRETMDELMRDSTVTNAIISSSKGAYDGLGESVGKPLPVPSLANVGLGEDETQGRDTLTYEKPSMDIFKAIFADSEDDEEDGDDDDAGRAMAGPLSKPLQINMQFDDPSAQPDIDLFKAIPSKEVSTILTMETVSSFKPTFTSKTDRKTTNGETIDKERKKKKKKSGVAAALSFDVEDGDESGMVSDMKDSQDKDRSKKCKLEDKDRSKKKKKEKQVQDTLKHEEDEWVEKEQVASSIQKVKVTYITAPHVAQEDGSLRGKNQRVKASELF